MAGTGGQALNNQGQGIDPQQAQALMQRLAANMPQQVDMSQGIQAQLGGAPTLQQANPIFGGAQQAPAQPQMPRPQMARPQPQPRMPPQAAQQILGQLMRARGHQAPGVGAQPPRGPMGVGSFMQPRR